MRPGSVIVDMAAEMGGNSELTEAGKEIVKHGVRIIGLTNLPATMPGSATQMYAKNIQTLVKHLVTDGDARSSTSTTRSRGARPSPTAARSCTRRPPRRSGSSRTVPAAMDAPAVAAIASRKDA